MIVRRAIRDVVAGIVLHLSAAGAFRHAGGGERAGV
jgi:hypothetical protein